MFKSDLTEIVSLAYLTGIFPIGRYDTESALNNFQDINMLTPQWPITKYFGFNENDVKQICLKHDLNFESAKLWYDGYHLGNEDIYNPYSITQLILERLYTSYWIRTGSFEHVLKVINQNVDGIRDLILSLMSGNKYQNIDTTKFKNTIVEIKDRNTALIYLVHLGYLTFKQNADGTNEISIPNEEVRQVFVSNIDTGQRPTS